MINAWIFLGSRSYLKTGFFFLFFFFFFLGGGGGQFRVRDRIANISNIFRVLGYLCLIYIYIYIYICACVCGGGGIMREIP